MGTDDKSLNGSIPYSCGRTNTKEEKTERYESKRDHLWTNSKELYGANVFSSIPY